MPRREQQFSQPGEPLFILYANSTVGTEFSAKLPIALTVCGK